MKDIFEEIISQRRWADATCGTGSRIDFTAPLREKLPSLLAQYNITSMLDAPCGDYSWMSLVEIPETVKYTGGDIVGFMIDKNRETYPGVEFIELDITSDALPEVDLLFCRDCLIHFGTADVQKTLQNIASSTIKYVLLTSYHDDCYSNRDIATGDFRPISFTKEPFDLGTPLESIVDWIPGTRNGDSVKFINLWSTSSIRDYLKLL